MCAPHKETIRSRADNWRTGVLNTLVGASTDGSSSGMCHEEVGPGWRWSTGGITLESVCVALSLPSLSTSCLTWVEQLTFARPSFHTICFGCFHAISVLHGTDHELKQGSKEKLLFVGVSYFPQRTRTWVRQGPSYNKCWAENCSLWFSTYIICICFYYRLKRCWTLSSTIDIILNSFLWCVYPFAKFFKSLDGILVVTWDRRSGTSVQKTEFFYMILSKMATFVSVPWSCLSQDSGFANKSKIFPNASGREPDCL